MQATMMARLKASVTCFFYLMQSLDLPTLKDGRASNICSGVLKAPGCNAPSADAPGPSMDASMAMAIWWKLNRFSALTYFEL